MNHKISNSVVRTDLALGLSIDFDFHSCITFIELRKFNLLVQVFEDNVTSAMERIYIELLKIITND